MDMSGLNRKSLPEGETGAIDLERTLDDGR
jgi:hypothetical protein